jgi:hypothetical protein
VIYSGRRGLAPMNTLKRALALAALASITACGGSGAKSQSPLPGASAAAIAHNPDASGTLTLKFPAHVATAQRTVSAGKRAPAYINPFGGSLVITALNQTLADPANGNLYFGLGTQNPGTGTSTLTIPLLSGTYNPGDLSVREFDGATGNGNLLASGSNQQYTDASGIVQSGGFVLGPGGTAAPVITMVMNVAGIALTGDPVAGNNSVVLSPDSINPTPVGCFPQGPYYVFPVDGAGTFVLPGQPSGFTGGDTNNLSPGVPTVQLIGSTSLGGPGSTLVPTILGGSYMINGTGTQSVEAHFQVSNPINGALVDGYVDLTPTSGC